MKFLTLIGIFFIVSGVNCLVSPDVKQLFSTCAAGTPADLAPALSASNDGYSYASANNSINTMQLYSSLTTNITAVGTCPNVINSKLSFYPAMQVTSIIIGEFNKMIVMLQSTVDTCSAFNQTAVTELQSNITLSNQQIIKSQKIIQMNSKIMLTLVQILTDANIFFMIDTIKSFSQLINDLVIATKNGMIQNPMMMFLYEALDADSQSAAVIGIENCYDADMATYMNALQSTIGAANVTLNSMNVSTQTQVKQIIDDLNSTMYASATSLLIPTQQAAVVNYIDLTITAMNQLFVEVSQNITDAFGRLTSLFGTDIEAALQNITQMGEYVRTFITDTITNGGGLSAPVICARTSLPQLEFVVSNASNYLGKCVTQDLVNINDYMDQVVKAFEDKGNNATDSINSCIQLGTVTEEEFKSCLEEGSDSGSTDLQQILTELSNAMQQGGENELKVMKCKEDKENDAFNAVPDVIEQFNGCLSSSA